jgi:3-oxoacyl-[acyl-carrier protein] reductase
MTSSDSPLYAILGATGGIGSELCRRLSVSAQGARLVVGARREEPLKEIEGELGAAAIPVDARSFEEVDRFFDEVASMGTPLSGVVNCAGSLLLKPAHQTSQQEFDETVAANLTTAFATVRSAAPILRKSGGAIVLVSSAAAQIGLPNHEAIGAVKAAVGGLAVSAAATYASSKIRVNAVAPGLVRTPMTSRIVENEVSLKASTAMHSLGRIGEPSDVASLIAWLLGPESSWITGKVGRSRDGGG